MNNFYFLTNINIYKRRALLLFNFMRLLYLYVALKAISTEANDNFYSEIPHLVFLGIYFVGLLYPPFPIYWYSLVIRSTRVMNTPATTTHRNYNLH